MPTKPGHITSARARQIAAMRKTFGSGDHPRIGGRPAQVRACINGCGYVGSARELWVHERSRKQCPALAK